jgi:hypothetical protein
MVVASKSHPKLVYDSIMFVHLCIPFLLYTDVCGKRDKRAPSLKKNRNQREERSNRSLANEHKKEGERIRIRVYKHLCGSKFFFVSAQIDIYNNLWEKKHK